MENKNEKIPQELDLEQMEEISGGEGGPVTRCDICGATFTDYRKYLAGCRRYTIRRQRIK